MVAELERMEEQTGIELSDPATKVTIILSGNPTYGLAEAVRIALEKCRCTMPGAIISPEGTASLTLADGTVAPCPGEDTLHKKLIYVGYARDKLTLNHLEGVECYILRNGIFEKATLNSDGPTYPLDDFSLAVEGSERFDRELFQQITEAAAAAAGPSIFAASVVSGSDSSVSVAVVRAADEGMYGAAPALPSWTGGAGAEAASAPAPLPGLDGSGSAVVPGSAAGAEAEDEDTSTTAPSS